MDGGDVDPVGEQCAHNRRHLGLGQDEITHHHGLVPHGLEGDPSTEGKARLD